jgi:hypothetical protein
LVGSAALAASTVVLAAGERHSAETTTVARGLTAAVELPAPRPPIIQCDLHPIAADSSISFARAARGSEPELSWPVAVFCEGGGGAASELLDAFGGEALPLRAWFEPALPFHAIDIEWNSSEHSVRIRRAPSENVVFTVDGVACDRLVALEVTSPALSSAVRATKTGPHPPCHFTAALPLEAFNTSLRFELQPARYTARSVAFDRLTLAVHVEAKPVTKKRVKPAEIVPRPEPCVPPKYCWR